MRSGGEKKKKKKEDVVLVGEDRGGGEKHEDKCGAVTRKKTGQGRRKQYGENARGLHACLKTTSCAFF